MRTLVVFAVCVFPHATSFAQDGDRVRETLFSRPETRTGAHGAPPMATDRPDFTESSATVGRGVTQLEVGYTFARTRGSESHSWGEPLLRHGLFAPWLELRVAFAPVSQRSDVTVSGTEDLYLGVKLALTPQHGPLPEIALVVQATVPTGSPAFTADRVLGGANLLYGWDVSPHWSVAGSTQYNRASRDASHSYGEWAQSVTIARSLSDRIGSYAEWFGIFGDSADEQYANGGLTFAATDDLQFDVRVGKGLTDDAEDLFVGTGVSIRFR